MLEVGMLITLALMGVYFVKSTDLPKELTERSAQLRAETEQQQINTQATKKMSFQTEFSEKSQLALLNLEIDKLTLEITTLEQQIKANNAKNAEIQAKIDSQLVALADLHRKVQLLS